MSTHFDRNPKTLTDSLPAAMVYHPSLEALKVQVLLVLARRYNSAEEPVAAVKLAGAPMAAKIRVLPLKQRVITDFDVEIMVDGMVWDDYTEGERVALLDHELTHLEVCVGTDGRPKMDDRGRPKLKTIGDDWVSHGFFDVIRRHGLNATEAKTIQRLNTQVLAALEDAGVATASMVAKVAKPRVARAGDTEEEAA